MALVAKRKRGRGACSRSNQLEGVVIIEEMVMSNDHRLLFPLLLPPHLLLPARHYHPLLSLHLHDKPSPRLLPHTKGLTTELTTGTTRKVARMQAAIQKDVELVVVVEEEKEVRKISRWSPSTPRTAASSLRIRVDVRRIDRPVSVKVQSQMLAVGAVSKQAG